MRRRKKKRRKQPCQRKRESRFKPKKKLKL